ALPEAERTGTLSRAAATVQTSLSLERGPLFRVILFALGEETPGRLLLAGHHLLLDTVSLQILAEDLAVAAEPAERGGDLALPRKTTSFKQWAERLVAHAQGESLAAEIPYWLLATREEVPALPVDLPGGSNSEVSAETLATAFDEEETKALLQELPR